MLDGDGEDIEGGLQRFTQRCRVRFVAMEPSDEMIRRRTGRSREVVRARAEALPYGSGAFDAGLAVFTATASPSPAAGR